VVLDRRFDAAADYSARYGGHALVVVRDDTVVYEAGQNGFRAHEPHRVLGGTLAFTCALAAAAVEDGLFELGDRVAEIVPEFGDDPWKREIEVGQLLRHTSGLESGLVPMRSEKTRDRFATAVALSPVAPPDNAFRYGPSHVFVFGEVMRRKLGGGDPVEYLRRRVLDPIGARPAEWDRDAAGNPDLAWGAWMSARDWARYGRLLRDEGEFDGREILDDDAVEPCFEGSRIAPFYGLGLWKNFQTEGRRYVARNSRRRTFYEGGLEDMVVAAGAGNQRLYVIPSLDLVIARFGAEERNWSDQDFLELVIQASGGS